MRRFAITAVAVVLIASPAALSDPADTGLYIGGSIGVAFVENSLPLNVSELEEEDFSWKIAVGYRAANFFAVEGNYRDFGSVSTSSGFRFDTASTAFDIDGLGILKLGAFDLFAKLGVAFWDTEASAGPVPIPADDSGTGIAYGLGFMFRMRSLGIRLEYEVIDASIPDELSMLTAGVTWTF